MLILVSLNQNLPPASQLEAQEAANVMPLYSYYLVEMLAHVALNSSQHPVSIMVINIKYIIYCSGQVKQFC